MPTDPCLHDDDCPAGDPAVEEVEEGPQRRRSESHPLGTPGSAAVLMAVLAVVWAMLWSQAPDRGPWFATAFPAGLAVGCCVSASLLALRDEVRRVPISNVLAVELVALALLGMFAPIWLYALLSS